MNEYIDGPNVDTPELRKAVLRAQTCAKDITSALDRTFTRQHNRAAQIVRLRDILAHMEHFEAAVDEIITRLEDAEPTPETPEYD